MPLEPLRGVDHPLLVGVKSTRTTRTPSLVKTSRQNGQHGVDRGDVFASMLLEQLKHRMCPGGRQSTRAPVVGGRDSPQGIEWG